MAVEMTCLLLLIQKEMKIKIVATIIFLIVCNEIQAQTIQQVSKLSQSITTKILKNKSSKSPFYFFFQKQTFRFWSAFPFEISAGSHFQNLAYFFNRR
ncbi:hypothetical protein ASG22_00835 [Chryseobacterium sp. Leaf405]|nr:hypothetical protein ASG22_00835 [Chryseobacterium sp. Leaf405]